MDANARRIPRSLEDRLEAPDAAAKIGGREYSLRAWSARGLLIYDYAEPRERGEKLRYKVHCSLNGTGRSFETAVFVVRLNAEEKSLAAVFVDYDRLAALSIDAIFYPDGD